MRNQRLKHAFSHLIIAIAMFCSPMSFAWPPNTLEPDRNHTLALCSATLEVWYNDLGDLPEQMAVEAGMPKSVGRNLKRGLRSIYTKLAKRLRRETSSKQAKQMIAEANLEIDQSLKTVSTELRPFMRDIWYDDWCMSFAERELNL